DQPATARTDVYAMGATLYQFLTGEPPFVEPSPIALLESIVKKPAPDVRAKRPEVTAKTRAIIESCLAKEPEKRPKDAYVLAQLLAAARVQLESASSKKTVVESSTTPPAVTAPAKPPMGETTRAVRMEK